MGLVFDERKQRVVDNIPTSIRVFDDKGPNDYSEIITAELEENVFGNESSEGRTLRYFIECVENASNYLRNEIETKILLLKRYDILRIGVKTVVETVCRHLNPVLAQDSQIYLSSSLGDLHRIIRALTKFQNQLNDIYYGPIDPHPPPFPLGQKLTEICNRYVNGTYGVSTSTKFEGAVHHLVPKCMDVINKFIAKPSDAIQKHDNGSFYTTVPIDLWELLNQHLELANETESTVLQAMIAGKIHDTLKQVMIILIDFVRTAHIFELELLSAVTNDTALMIEEVCRLVESIGNEEVRIAVNETYGDLILDFIWCGQTCLLKLVDIIIFDVKDQLDLVLTESWLKGSPINIMLATLRDYSLDFEKYLMPFWLDRFFVLLLEMVVLRYAYALVFKDCYFDKTSLDQKNGNSVLKYKASKVDRVPLESETLAHIAKNMSSLTEFIAAHLTAPRALRVMSIVNDILDYLQSSFEEICDQASNKITKFPHAAQARMFFENS
jgi:hypothetical protein